MSKNRRENANKESNGASAGADSETALKPDSEQSRFIKKGYDAPPKRFPKTDDGTQSA